MKAKVLGVQNVDYKSKKTGEQVVGHTLHVSFKDADVRGEAVDSPFISERLGLSNVISALQPGQMVEIVYNRRGYVADVEPLK